MLLAETSVPGEEYNLVEIRIFLSADGGKTYPVELEVPGWRAFPTRVLQLDETRLSAQAKDPRAYGRSLGEMLFAADAVGDAFKETLAAIEAGSGALRLRLRIDPRELQTTAWERLLAPIDGNWQPLAAVAATPFSRFVLAQDWERPAPVTKRPLRMLAVIASPANLDTFNLDPIAADERKALHDLLDGLPGVAVTYLESGTETPPTLNDIRAALADGQHIVHLLCHGAATAEGTALFLEGDDGAVEVVQAGRLLDAFALVKTPPLLCFLAACETAARGRQDAFVPLGPALVERGGASAVIAMSDRVGLDTARLFTGQYYARLLSHGVADLAMNEARALVQDQWDWGVPVLFSRLDDCQLFAQPEKAPARRRLQAPPPPATFAGRVVVLDRLSQALMSQPDAQVSVAIQGIGGQGKSTVARRLGHDLAKEFPGGVLWLEVGPAPAAGGGNAAMPGAAVDPKAPWSQGPPVDGLASQKSSIIGHIAQELDLNLSDVPRLEDRAAIVQHELGAGGRLLAVLDDLWDPDLGRWLMQEVLPDQRAVLITTRLLDVARALADHVERLRVLNEAEGVEMLAGILGPLGRYDEAARQIVGLLEGLPLALELAARRCDEGASDLPWLLRQMQSKPTLGVLVLPGQASRETSVEYSLSMSLQGLDAKLAERFRALGVFAPAPFDLAALAAVWQDAELDVAEEAARQLARRALLARGEDRLAAGATPEHPVYAQHALLRAYALALAQRAGEAEAAAGRHAAYFKALPAETGEQGERFWPQVEHAWDRVDSSGLLDERLAFMRSVRTFMQRQGRWQPLRQRTEQLLSTLRKAEGRPEDEAEMLTYIGVTFSRQDNHQEALQYFNEARSIYETTDDKSGRVENLNCIGVAYRNLRDFQDALDTFNRARQLLLNIDDQVGMGDTQLNIGMTLRRMGRTQEALQHLLFAERKFTEAKEFGRLSVALNEIGEAHREMRQYREALTYCGQALQYREKTGLKGGKGVTLCSIGKIFQAQGDSQQALESYGQALPLLRQAGNRDGETLTSYSMAMIYVDLGDLVQAERLLVRTVELDEAIHHPDLESHRAKLEQVRSRLLNLSGEKAAGRAPPVNSTGVEGDQAVGLAIDPPVP